jgi:hypothetical protein
MKEFVKTYAMAKAAYDTIVMKINSDLSEVPEYTKAMQVMTPDLLRSDEKEFDRLNLLVCELETSMEARHEKWNLFECLRLAEDLLIDEYGDFLLKRNCIPAGVKELFTSPMKEELTSSPCRRSELIAIILKTPGF